MQHYGWAHGMDLTMDTISQVIHDCKTCTAVKQGQVGKAPVVWGGDGQNINMGRPASQAHHTPADPPRQVLHADSGVRHHWMIEDLTALPRTPSGP